MKVKRLLCIVFSLAAVCSLALTRDSVAWFNTPSGTEVSATLAMKTLDFTFNGKLQSYLFVGDSGTDKFIISEQNLITDNDGKISLVNRSTIKTDVRFRIVYDKPGAADTIYTASQNDHLKVTVPNDWGSPDSDGYYERSFNASTANNTNAVDMITFLGFDDE